MEKQILSEEFKRMQKLAGIINELSINDDIILEKFIETFDTSGGYQGPLDKGVKRSVVVDRNDYSEEEDQGEYDYELNVFDECYNYLQKHGGKLYYSKYDTKFLILDDHTISYNWIQE